MRVLAALLFSSAAVLAPAIAAAQTTMAPAAPAVAATQATTAPAAPATAAPSSTSVATTDSSPVNLDEVVCKNEPPTTGSRLGGGRECHTVREWNERERQAQNLTRLQQREGLATKGKDAF